MSPFAFRSESILACTPPTKDITTAGLEITFVSWYFHLSRGREIDNFNPCFQINLDNIFVRYTNVVIGYAKHGVILLKESAFAWYALIFWLILIKTGLYTSKFYVCTIALLPLSISPQSPQVYNFLPFGRRQKESDFFPKTFITTFVALCNFLTHTKLTRCQEFK